jgi:rhodanese-related sulfurtransferase
MRRSLPVYLIAFLLTAVQAWAVENMPADEALRLASAGKTLLIDIRTPGEWKQTGVPKGAQMVDFYQPPASFLDAIAKATGGDKSKPVALICRTGNRSAKAAEILAAQGYTQIVHVGEGVAGSRLGPGWLARGLPVEAP